MNMKKIPVRFYVLAAMIIVAGLSRIVVHIDNFTPLGAIALFGGAHFSNQWKAYLMPLISLFLSDLILQGIVYEGKYGFPLYEGWYWVYGTFALIVLTGNVVIKKVNVINVLLASAIASLAHWIITDFWVWNSELNLALYPKNINGLVLCYTMALPYLKNFFVGTLAYSVLLFGVFEWAQVRFPVVSKTSASS
jgi:hypothetical protein